MSLQGLDTEDFIDEVKKYPCIWNLQCDDYRRTALKTKAWDQVATTFIENYDELADYDRVTISKKLQNKWRNLRDSYVRTQKKKPGESSSRYYLFARNLSFLEIAYGDKLKIRLSSDSEDSSEETTVRRKKIKTESPLPAIKIRQTQSSENFNLEYVGTPCSVEPLQVQQALPPEEFDDDRMFFESLLPATRHLDMDQKLLFRTEVLSLISKIRQNARTNPLEQKF